MIYEIKIEVVVVVGSAPTRIEKTKMEKSFSSMNF